MNSTECHLIWKLEVEVMAPNSSFTQHKEHFKPAIQMLLFLVYIVCYSGEQMLANYGGLPMYTIREAFFQPPLSVISLSYLSTSSTSILFI